LTTTVTDTCEIGVFTAAKSGATEWQVRPLKSVAIATGSVTITLDSWKLIDPDLWEFFPTSTTEANGSLIDISTTGNFVTSIDVYRIFTDFTEVSAKFFWERDPVANTLVFCSTCGLKLYKTVDSIVKETSSIEIISALDVYKTYLMGMQAVPALRGIDLSVKSGEFLAIMGPSGSGKSTLMHLFGGLDQPTQGSIRFMGTDLAVLTRNSLAEHRLHMTGFIFQTFHLMPTLTAAENISLPMIFARMKKDLREEKLSDILEWVNLEERAYHLPSELSGGEQQRVAIGRALANDPPLILADEPTGDLDSKTGTRILNILKKLNTAGRTIVMVTHDRQIAEFANKIVSIFDGKITGEEILATNEA